MIIPLAIWEGMQKDIKDIKKVVRTIKATGTIGHTILRRETTEVITKKTIEETIAEDEDAAKWYSVQLEMKATLGKQLKKVTTAIREEEEQLKPKTKSKRKTRTKKKKKEIVVNAR